jgi:hypothetical protein
MTTHRPPGDDLPLSLQASGVHAADPRRRAGGAQGDLPPGPRDASGLLRRVRDRARVRPSLPRADAECDRVRADARRLSRCRRGLQALACRPDRGRAPGESLRSCPPGAGGGNGGPASRQAPGHCRRRALPAPQRGAGDQAPRRDARTDHAAELRQLRRDDRPSASDTILGNATFEADRFLDCSRTGRRCLPRTP